MSLQLRFNARGMAAELFGRGLGYIDNDFSCMCGSAEVLNSLGRVTQGITFIINQWLELSVDVQFIDVR